MSKLYNIFNFLGSPHGAKYLGDAVSKFNFLWVTPSTIISKDTFS